MVMPYLNFTGDCEAAFSLYQEAFNAKPPLLARYKDSPPSPDQPLPAGWQNKIMHGHIMLTATGGISGTDAIWPVEPGASVYIHVLCDEQDIAQKAYQVLAKEGCGLSPLAPNPPPHDSDLSGMVRDKFGFTWVLSAPR